MKKFLHIITLAVLIFGCATTFSCRTAKTSERIASSHEATEACNHSETQSVSEWASFLRLLQLDSLTIELPYGTYPYEYQAVPKSTLRADLDSAWYSSPAYAQLSASESPAVPKSTHGVDFGSTLLSPANRFAASAAAPPNHPPAAAKAPARIKAYGLHLSTSSEAQSAATLAASDSVNKSTQSTVKTEETVKRTSPYYIYIAMAILTLIMAILAIIYFSRTRL